MKICSACKRELPETDFYRLKSGRLQSACKACGRAAVKKWIVENPKALQQHQRKSWLKRKFGMTLEQYDVLLRHQGGVCAICKKPESGKSLAVDHCHETGKIRGLLCDSCNQGLGMFKEQISVMRAAAEYLDEANGHG